MPKIHVAESIEIAASPERAFDVVADFGSWTKWSPWLGAEPEAKVEVTDNPSSVGSGYRWSGEVVGEGEMEHVRLDPGKRIEEDLRFIRPWKSQADVSFDFARTGNGTKVTWTMDSSLPWFMFWMKPTMQNMIGMDYERGLKMLKEHIETGKVLSKTNVRGVTNVGPLHMVGVRKACAMADISSAMTDAIEEAESKLAATQVPTENVKMAAYHKFDPGRRSLDFTAGILVLDPDATVPGLATWSVPESQAFAVEHVGSYQNLGNGWGAAYQHVRNKKLKLNNRLATFEIYRNEPPDTQPADLVTDIFLPLK